MSLDLDDPKMVGYTPLEEFRAKDASSSSRRVRERTDQSPISLNDVLDIFKNLGSFSDDEAAAAGGIKLHGLYRTDSIIKVRVD